MDISHLDQTDWADVQEIYLQGIRGGDATFEREVPDWRAWNESHLITPRLVARDDEGVIGWAALSPVSRRRVYSGVAEVSVYVAESSQGRGVGRTLLEQLVERSEGAGIWTLQAGIFPENIGSIAIHLKCGFRIVGTRERLGRQGDRWRDVVLLERRSALI